MQDSSGPSGDVITVIPRRRDDRQGTSAFDWDHFIERTNALFVERGGVPGAITNEDRCALAGISESTFYRLQRGAANLTMDTHRDIALNIGTTSARLMGEGK